MICAMKGYRFVPVSNDAIAPEKLNTMRAFGAELIVLKTDSGKLTPEIFHRMRAEVDRLRAEPGTFWTDQFNNTDALDGYVNIGRELFEQAGGTLDAFCGGVGTGGMLAGVSKALKAAGSAARIVALEPASAPFMTKGHGGPHRVEGVGAFPKVAHLSTPGVYDEARAIDESEARAMARELARKEGILAGTSSAMNVVAALQLARELGPGKTVATVAVDTGLKYLTGDLFASV
jgi:cysteine synthase A